MNIYKDKLEVGQVFKNYKALCEYLGEDSTLEGNSKKAQEKELKRYFDYEKIEGSRSLSIVNIHCIPLEKKDNNKGGNNAVKYIDIIGLLILDMLNKSEGEISFISTGKLLTALKMVNTNYSKGKYSMNKFSKEIDIDINEVKDFYSTSDSVLKSNIESALKRLSSKALIIWNHTVTVAILETSIDFHENMEIVAFKNEKVNEFGDKTYDFDVSQAKHKLNHRKASTSERASISRAEKEVLDQLGYEDKYSVFMDGKRDMYYQRVNKILFDSLNIHMYYKSYEITFDRTNVEDELDEKLYTLTDNIRRESQKELNEGVVDRLKLNAENRNNNAFNKYVDSNKQKHKIRMSFDYISNFNKMLEHLVENDFATTEQS